VIKGHVVEEIFRAVEVLPAEKATTLKACVLPLKHKLSTWLPFLQAGLQPRERSLQPHGL
jgi:hypothetical protein